MSQASTTRPKNKVVLYTVNIGGYDYVREPTFLPAGCDLVYFTDQPITSKHWQVREVPIWNDDPQRTSRRYKIMPHRYLADYEYSVYFDANIALRGDVNELLEQYLADTNLAVFSHANLPDNDKCVYEHAEKLMRGNNGTFKDDPAVIKEQIDGYKAEGFPDEGGLLSGMIILRRHNADDVVATMETWWQEVKTKSRRDQLSFNYAAWKNNLQFTYMPGNSRDNACFIHTTHNKPTWSGRFRWLFTKKIPQLLGHG